MSRGRKAKGNDTNLSWQQIFSKNVGKYLQKVIVELSLLNNRSTETGIELLEKIKVKKSNTKNELLPIEIGEIRYPIPKNWVWCRLGEIGESTIGVIFKPNQVGLKGIPVLKANNVQNNKIDYSDLILVDMQVREKQIAKKGDILICVRSGSNNLIGKSAIIDKEGMSFGAFMTLYRSPINKYVHRFMTSELFKQQIDDKKSTGINQLTQGTLNNILLPLPPISEQENILNFLTDFENDNLKEDGFYFNEAVEQKVIALHEAQLKGFEIADELNNQLSLVKNLRQQLLQDAVQGRLMKNTAENTETAHDLLKKIKTEKAQLIKEKKLKKEKELPPIKADEIPFDIPKDWAWCRLGEICTKIGSGSTPNGSNYSNEGTPFFRSQNIHNIGLIYDDIKFINDEVHKQMNGTTVYANDILLNITGGSMGRCALVPNDFEEGNVSQHVCIIRPLLVNRLFYHTIVLSPFFQKNIFSSTTGAGREGLPKYNLEQFLIPLPPLQTQAAIVSKLEQLMNDCTALEASIQASAKQNEQLLQRVLREALQG